MDDSQAALAAEFVQVCKTAGINLDFQPRTLPFVDKYLTASRPEAQQQVNAIAAYVGEVIRRETGGLWYEHEGNAALDCGEHQIDPLAFINLLIEVRAEVRKQKLWALSDQIRDKLKELGVTIEDSKDGTKWRWG